MADIPCTACDCEDHNCRYDDCTHYETVQGFPHCLCPELFNRNDFPHCRIEIPRSELVRRSAQEVKYIQGAVWDDFGDVRVTEIVSRDVIVIEGHLTYQTITELMAFAQGHPLPNG